MRCPNCGNDVLASQYTCHVCSTVLIIEGLERRVSFLARHQERWKKPAKFTERVKWMFIHPSRAMWDIVHKPSDAGGAFALIFNMLLFGLVGVVLFNKIGGTMLPFDGLIVYLMFVVIGLFYFVILWGFIILAQSIAAKYVLNINPKWFLQLRVLYWTFIPSLLFTGIYIVILAIGLPQVNGISDPLAIAALFFTERSKPVWIVADIIQIVFYFGYLPILLTIAIREYYDKSTTKTFIAALITSVIGAVVFVLTRGSFA